MIQKIHVRLPDGECPCCHGTGVMSLPPGIGGVESHVCRRSIVVSNEEWEAFGKPKTKQKYIRDYQFSKLMECIEKQNEELIDKIPNMPKDDAEALEYLNEDEMMPPLLEHNGTAGEGDTDENS